MILLLVVSGFASIVTCIRVTANYNEVPGVNHKALRFS